MQDLQKEKYLDLMTQIDDLEDLIEKDKTNQKAKEKLADVRNELARVCDGCGTFHTKNL